MEKKLHIFFVGIQWKSLILVSDLLKFQHFYLEDYWTDFKNLSVLKCYDFSLQVKNTSSTFPRLSDFPV